MARRTFYAAKINIHGNIFSQNLDELINIEIPRVILDAKPLKINTWNWSFTDVEKIGFEGETFIIGHVTKSKHAKQTIRVGDKTKEVKSEHELASRAFFIYYPNEEILIHESTTGISSKEFPYFFTRLLSRDPYVGEVKIKPIPVPHLIRKEILSIENITKICFYLIHPNPGKEEFNLYQEIIKEVGLKELNIEMVNKDGFIVQNNTQKGDIQFKRTIENGINLVEKGYGEIEVAGFDKITRQGKKKKIVEKKNRKFSSTKSVRLIHVNENDPKRLISRLYKFIMDVKNKLL